jgi:hypothetical protein
VLHCNHEAHEEKPRIKKEKNITTKGTKNTKKKLQKILKVKRKKKISRRATKKTKIYHEFIPLDVFHLMGGYEESQRKRIKSLAALPGRHVCQLGQAAKLSSS